MSLHDKEEIVSSIQMEVSSFLQEQLQYVEVDELDSTVDSPIGNIEYKLGNMKLKMPEDHEPVIDVKLEPRAIVITVTDLTATVPLFNWSYR